MSRRSPKSALLSYGPGLWFWLVGFVMPIHMLKVSTIQCIVKKDLAQRVLKPAYRYLLFGSTGISLQGKC